MNDDAEHDGHAIAWVDGHTEPTTDFDWDAIDRGNPLSSELEGASDRSSADGLHEIFAWCFRDGAAGLVSAFVRFTCIAMLIDPRWLDNESMKQVGERFGITKSAISKVCCEFQDRFSIKFRRSRPKSARLNMAKSMQGKHNALGTRRGAKINRSTLP